MLLVVQPWTGTLDLGSIFMLFSALFWAGSMIAIKILMRDESSLTTTILTIAMSIPFTFVAALAVWKIPTGEQFVWLAFSGVAFTMSQLTFAQALKEADLTALLPLDFFKLIWAAIIGYLFFAEIPAITTWLGGSIIFGAATFIAYRESKVDRTLPGTGR